LIAGKQIIVEIKKRGFKGYFFTYNQYQELKKMVIFNDAKTKIALLGYPSVMTANNAKEIVDIIQKEEKLKDRYGCFHWAIMEMSFFIIISFVTCS